MREASSAIAGESVSSSPESAPSLSQTTTSPTPAASISVTIAVPAAPAPARCHTTTNRVPRATLRRAVSASCSPTVGVSRSVTVESTIVTPS